MRCGARTPGDCLEDHVRPFLREPKLKGPESYKALATCHPDREPSLSVSVRDGRIVWWCFARCSSDATRNSMIMRGVPARCLIRPAADVTADVDLIRAIVSGKDSHAHKVLLIAAVLDGQPVLPGGYALESLAEGCGVGAREAYKARKLGLHP